MKADRVEISRDEPGNRWLVRIQVGEEVIRRHCKDLPSADEAALRDAAVKTAGDEGYTIKPSEVILA